MTDKDYGKKLGEKLLALTEKDDLSWSEQRAADGGFFMYCYSTELAGTHISLNTGILRNIRVGYTLQFYPISRRLSNRIIRAAKQSMKRADHQEHVQNTKLVDELLR